MERYKRHSKIILCLVSLVALICFTTELVKAQTCDCTDTADPPFLSAGADPNLLLMIDNSGSMYDVAHTAASAADWECFDSSYGLNPDAVYGGYFIPETWYHYVETRFETVAAPPAATLHGGTRYTGTDLVAEQWSDAIGWHVDLFMRGKLLNWATASKFDIEKKVLTGGKFDKENDVLISEGRGCSGHRFFKQLEVKDASGNLNYLVLGVRADDDKDTPVDNDTTVMDVFKITPTPFDFSQCRAAIIDMMGDDLDTETKLNELRDALESCMGVDHSEMNNPDKQAFLHATQDCWFINKHPDSTNWPNHDDNLIKECMAIYQSGIDPRTISPADPAFACYGVYNADPALANGYIGRCWKPVGNCNSIPCGAEYVPPNNQTKCEGGVVKIKVSGKWVVKLACEGGASPEDAGWMGSDPSYDGTGVIPDALLECVEAAERDLCQWMEVPQVVDPSSQTLSTGEVWNLPAILADVAGETRLGKPIAQMNAVISASQPSGIVQEFSNLIRMGAMAFNIDGSASECAKDPQDHLFTACEGGLPTGENKDGAKIISYIGDTTETLITGINNEKAKTWTPLAEAMLSAVGYYTQNSDYRLNESDFIIPKAPITSWCQSNNVLFITDGASTQDLALKAQLSKDGDTDKACVPAKAGQVSLNGSTYFDDLTYFAWQGKVFDINDFYSFEKSPKDINTFIVFTGNKTESTDECTPYPLMENAVKNGGPNAPNDPEMKDTVYEGGSGDPEQLSKGIRDAITNILKRASAGSAASVIAATRGGEGAVYQAIFWPRLDDPEGKPEVSWGGEVHALLVDEFGQLHSDDNGDKAYTLAEDKRVVFFFDDKNEPNETKACYDGDIDAAGVCSGTVKSINDVKYLWSASEWLAGIGNDDILSNRATYISNEKKRYVFTWNDLNNDGAVDAGAGLDGNEVLSFVPARDWGALPVVSRPLVPYDFGVATDAEVDAIVSWVRGKDSLDDPTVRKRLVPKPTNFAAGLPATITWRLGDIIYSTPTAVGRPAEAYHQLYRDESYAQFVDHYRNRRNVIYFGGNDGLFHAVNGGFYNESAKGFCRAADCTNDPTTPELGAELWAYAPYNLLPHLHCLKNADYLHKYFMDLKPRIFDVQIFVADDDHPQGWGTILVAGMRQGGGKVDTGPMPADTRKFTSSYVVMDISNPEKPPVLLGEVTFNPGTSMDLAHTVSIPAVVPMKKGATTKWYLVVGSGPTDMDAAGLPIWGRDGTSNQTPKIGVFPLDTLTKGSRVFRIPTTDPSESQAGSYELGIGNGMVSDIISVDYDLVPDYRADAIYFGTIEGKYASQGGAWNGRLYRWVTNADDDMSSPEMWGKSTTEVGGGPGVMFEPGRPITAAPTVGYDGTNFWVYFGTGRFMHKDDKTDSSSNEQETYYGIKEPLDCDGNFTWAAVANSDALTPPGPFIEPGARKLLRVDQILVHQADFAENALLSCTGGGTGCLPAGVENFEDLAEYISGEGCVDANNDGTKEFTGTDGWYLRFPEDRERNLGQATLLGGLLTFTTYQPFDDICKPEGEAYLYGVFYQTGTAWYKSVFNENIGLDAGGNVMGRVDIGRGLATTPNLHVGSEEGAKAFVQTSTGAIVEINQPNLPIKTSKSGRMSWRSE